VLLHLVKHRGQSCLHLESLLYLVGGDERILTIFEKAWALMFAHELDECRGVRLPIHREALKIFEDGVNAGLFKESDCIFCIFVKVSIEYALVHEIRIAADVEENPSQVVELERRENKRSTSYSVLYFFPVGTDYFLAPRFDLCDDRESRRAFLGTATVATAASLTAPVAETADSGYPVGTIKSAEAIIGRGLRKNRTVAPLLKLEISLLRDGHRRRLRPVARFCT
jgi:hypothetical protein